MKVLALAVLALTLTGVAAADQKLTVTPQSQPDITVAPRVTHDVFEEKYYAVLDRANTALTNFMYAPCGDEKEPAAERELHESWILLHQMGEVIKDTKQDFLTQDREFESYLGFKLVIANALKTHAGCLDVPETAPAPGSIEQ